MQPLHADPVAEVPQKVPRRNRFHGRTNYHLKPAATGPKGLAIKNHLIAMIGEFVGTSLFMLFALGGTNVANIPSTSVTGDTTAGQGDSIASAANTSNLLYISLCFGFSLAVNAWIFFRVSGGLFNPAVSWGMMLVGAITPLRAALLTISQILGGIVGSAIIQALLPGTLNVRTQLSPGMSVVRGLFLEMFLTAMLMLAILLLAAEKSKATFLAPIGIGLALFIAELLGVYYTGGSLNPARSFGPDVVLASFASYHWIYWLGPVLGSTLAAGFYRFIKWLEFETVLGPEDDDGRKTTGQLQAPPQNLLGTSPTVVEKPSALAPEEPPTKITDLAVQGPGLSDLLTEGESTAVYNLAQPPADYTTRLSRIEELLESLASNQLAPVRSSASGQTLTAHRAFVPQDSLANDDHEKYATERMVIGDENV
ncbi:uncharacterized protein JCM15063_003031 [Sporobolomyces koalae]|uniref:uncharacterized protein n=1 Tax=Sporobolomyces koalae TaxID=500713 RepID=UPI00316E7856